MRRLLIRYVLPFLFCLVPLAAAILIAFSLPVDAREFYFANNSMLDKFILVLGSVLFFCQVVLSLKAMQWQGSGFDERPDRWLSNLAQAAEWFPLLGLIGTVAGIMQTFAAFGATTRVVSQSEIIAKYAPAITATCSGLFMALANILPTWVVLVGRDLIATLGGAKAPEPIPAPAADQSFPAPVAEAKARSRGSEAGSGRTRV